MNKDIIRMEKIARGEHLGLATGHLILYLETKYPKEWKEIVGKTSEELFLTE